MKISIIIEKDKDGYFAYAPKLEGCVSEGETFEDARKNIVEAIELYLETLGDDECKDLDTSEVYTTVCEISRA